MYVMHHSCKLFQVAQYITHSLFPVNTQYQCAALACIVDVSLYFISPVNDEHQHCRHPRCKAQHTLNYMLNHLALETVQSCILTCALDRVQSFDHETVAGKLSALWTILGTQDIVKQQHAHPQRAQFGLYCPKVALMLEGWATDSLPARFEVAAQELSAKFQSGSQVGSAAQGSSAGAVSLQVDENCCVLTWQLHQFACTCNPLLGNLPDSGYFLQLSCSCPTICYTFVLAAV